jgi:nitrogen fixation protein FixH
MTRLRLFPGIIFVLIGLNMAIVGVTVTLALSDDAFAVTPDAYADAVRWDQLQEERRRGQALGWSLSAAFGPPLSDGSRLLAISAVGPDGARLTGANLEVEAFAHARPRGRVRITPHETDPGRYEARVVLPQPGLWSLRVSVRLGGDETKETLMAEVGS